MSGLTAERAVLKSAIRRGSLVNCSQFKSGRCTLLDQSPKEV